MASLDGIIALLDKTFFNPLLVGVVPPLLHYAFGQQLEIGITRSYLPFIVTTPSIKLILFLATFGAAIRLNRRLSRSALNNNTFDTYDWNTGDEIALVTGGAGGIGGEVAQMLAAKGIPVVVLDVMPLTFNKSKTGAEIHYYKCDLTDYEAFEQVAAKVRQEVGNPTLVFANAGIVRGKSLLDASKRDIETTFAVNNLALIWTIKLFVPHLVKKNHGHFLITASSTAYVTAPRMVDYSATKAAALAIWEGLQAELKHVYRAPQVKCSVICPSLIKTKMFEGMRNANEFVAPSLQPAAVAQLMVDTVLSGQSRHVLCPPALGNVVACVRGWPSWLRVAMQDAAHDAAASFSGHDPMNLKSLTS